MYGGGLHALLLKNVIMLHEWLWQQQYHLTPIQKILYSCYVIVSFLPSNAFTAHQQDFLFKIGKQQTSFSQHNLKLGLSLYLVNTVLRLQHGVVIFNTNLNVNTNMIMYTCKFATLSYVPDHLCPPHSFLQLHQSLFVLVPFHQHSGHFHSGEALPLGCRYVTLP